MQTRPLARCTRFATFSKALHNLRNSFQWLMYFSVSPCFARLTTCHCDPPVHGMLLQMATGTPALSAQSTRYESSSIEHSHPASLSSVTRMTSDSAGAEPPMMLLTSQQYSMSM